LSAFKSANAEQEKLISYLREKIAEDIKYIDLIPKLKRKISKLRIKIKE